MDRLETKNTFPNILLHYLQIFPKSKNLESTLHSNFGISLADGIPCGLQLAFQSPYKVGLPISGKCWMGLVL